MASSRTSHVDKINEKASMARYVTVETAVLQKRPPDQKECLSHSQLSGSSVTFDMTFLNSSLFSNFHGSAIGRAK